MSDVADEALPNATTFKWTPKMEAVALALAQGKTWDAVVKEHGSAKTTIARWMREPEFTKRIEEHHDAIIEDARRYLRRNALNAAQKVVQIMESGYPQHSLRLAAAKDVLDRVGLKAPEKHEHEHSGTIEHHAIAVTLEGRLLDLAGRTEHPALPVESDG